MVVFKYIQKSCFTKTVFIMASLIPCETVLILVNTCNWKPLEIVKMQMVMTVDLCKHVAS